MPTPNYLTKTVTLYTFLNLLHIQTIPALPFSPPDVTYEFGSWVCHDGTRRAAETLLGGFYDLVRATYQAGAAFQSWSVWTRPTVTDPWTFITGKQLGVNGTNISGAVATNNMATYTFTDTAGNPARMVLLDLPLDAYQPIRVATDLTAEQQQITGAFSDDAYMFVSRSGFKPLLFRAALYKFNDKLRRERHYT